MAARTGLVVAGAGARGAYEAGALTELLPRMARRWSAPSVLVGTSAGALNVAALAGLSDVAPDAAAAELVARWSSVRTEEVVALPSSAVEATAAYLGDLAGVPSWLRRLLLVPDRVTRLLDADRLRPVVDRVVDWDRMHEAVARGRVDAVGVACTAAGTGGTTVFVERGPDVALPPYDPGRDIRYVDARLDPDHLLASAAVPVLFAPRRIEGEAAGWYLDGGVRLNTPLKPALRLGADRVGVVATTPDVPFGESAAAPSPADRVPDVYAVAALALRIVLGAGVTEDLRTLRAVNALVDRGEDRRHRRIATWFAGPPADRATELAELADAVRRREYGGLRALRNPSLAVLERLVGGAVPDADTTHGAELLSFLFFDPVFAAAAADLGAAHAARAVAPEGGTARRRTARPAAR
ncbi:MULTISPECIES: patatin-like phospholipase family protein [Pseudonocardia]|uniref:patatin-like phospholipase family protein n=1 Tax=Pseudonocardia TaxID=1847 RepID=UPI001AD6E8D9|nr:MULTISPECIES: patatin-like phospholipase family protein [Pseudonocardia]MBO4238240.1 phospholipase [Pseudonocardia alni]